MNTKLYNFFHMVCVTVPTKQGFLETIKVQNRTINELELASKEM
jgi:hypothetical protein